MAQGNPAQSRAAGDVRPVAVSLHPDPGLFADLPEQSGGDPVGAVAQICVVLEDDALAHHRGVGGVCQLRVVGMHRMGVVRRDQEGLGQQPARIPIHCLANSAQSVLQEGRACALDRAGANLLAVEDAQHRNLRRIEGGVQEALGAAPGAFQVVQSRGGQVLLPHPPDGGPLPDVQVQVVAQDPAPGLFLQKLLKLPGVFLAAGERQGVHRRVPLVAVVDLAVHVNGHVGDQQQVPVDVHKLRLNAALRLHRHTARHGQGPIQPGEQQLAAVTLHRHPVIGSGKLKILLDLEAGPVGVAGTHEEAPRLPLRNPKGDQGRAAPVHIILSPRLKLPAPVLRQAPVACLFQHVPQLSLGVINAVRSVQKRTQLLDPMFQFGSSFAFSGVYRLFSIFYTRTVSPSTGEIWPANRQHSTIL